MAKKKLNKKTKSWNKNVEAMDNKLQIKSWNVAGIQGELCNHYLKILCNTWKKKGKPVPFGVNTIWFEVVDETFNNFERLSKICYTQPEQYEFKLNNEIKEPNRDFKKMTHIYFRKYFSIAQEILNDLNDNQNIIYFLQEVNYIILFLLENGIKNGDRSLNLLNYKIYIASHGTNITSVIIFNKKKFELIDKILWDLEDHFRSERITLMNVMWEQHGLMTGNDEKIKTFKEMSPDVMAWKEFKTASINKSPDNNLFGIVLNNKKTNKKLLCLNTHNPNWWTNTNKKLDTDEITLNVEEIDLENNSVNTEENIQNSKLDTDEITLNVEEIDLENNSVNTEENNENNENSKCIQVDIIPRSYTCNIEFLYAIRNTMLHQAICNIIKNINCEDLYTIFAGDFNIQGNNENDLSNHLDGTLSSDEYPLICDRLQEMRLNPQVLNSSFGEKFYNPHVSLYPRGNRKPKYKIKESKSCTNIHFFTQKGYLSPYRILDRIYISNNIELANMKSDDIIKKNNYSDHAIIKLEIKI